MAGAARIDGSVLRTWADGAVAALDAHRAELDALNVFPVADSDTGTNLWLTLREARAALGEDLDGLEGRAAARGFARGALVGARGNSGVIVSQYLGELLRSLPPVGLTGDDVVRALRRATDAAYAAVAEPVEGTVLSVAQAVADGAAEARGDLPDVLAAALEAGYLALRRTPEQLAPLRAAGVLDAGGWGLLLVLRALGDALGAPTTPWERPRMPDTRHPCAEADQGGAFEVMYVVTAASHGDDGHDGDDAGDRHDGADGGPPVADRLRTALAAVGDSVAVVGGDGLWQAHVHTDAPLDAVRSAAAAGVTATQVRVRHIGRQTGVHGDLAPALGLVAVTGAAGLTADLARAGAVVVLVGPGRVAGPELVRAVEDTGAAEVLVLVADELVAGDHVGGGRDARARVRDRLSEVQVVVGAATLASLASHERDAGRLADAVLAAVDGVRTTEVDGADADGGPGGGPGGGGPDRDADPVVTAARGLVTDETALVTALVADDAAADVGARLSAALGDRVEVVVLPTGLPGRRVVLGAEAGTA